MPLDSYTQTKRLLRIETPLGEDKLLLEQMDGSEALSSPFTFQLRVRAMYDTIDPSQIVHRPIDWYVRLDEEGSWRQWNGLVASYSGGEAITREQRSYSLMVVPWLWFLQHRQDCQVFQNKTVPQIATQVFDDAGFKDYDLSGLAQSYQPRIYCTQYRESDFNFVSRLFEEEGIFYYFKHEPGRHVLMLCDGAHAYRDLPDGTLPFNQSGIFKNSVTRWAHHQAFRSGRTATNDYNFENPGNSLLTTTNAAGGVPQSANYEIYDFPGRYVQRGAGEGVSKRLMQAHEKGQDTVSGGGRGRTLFPAGKFALEAHPVEGENGTPYALVSVMHHAAEGSYESVDKAAPAYQNTFTCLPASTDFVPEQRTEKPVIPGMQSAVVTGPSGEEIYTDKYGRVKCQFHWDRKGKKDENSSCWLRVAQPWAGKGFGAQTIPRIGMEVLVTFMEGDPDQPLIVGAMPNAVTATQLNLPAEKERTSFKSASSPGGNGFNELTFEDKAGTEELFTHGQKDMTTIVGNNKQTTVVNANTLKAGTLYLSTVGDAIIEKTPDHILIKYQASQIYLDGAGIRINFGDGHVIKMDAAGIHLHSSARVDASQGGESADNFVSITASGVDTHGQTVHMTGGSGSQIEMGDGGINQVGTKISIN